MKAQRSESIMDEYNQIILYLHSVAVKIEEQDQAIVILSSLPKIYEHIVDTMLYGKETLTMTEVKYVLNSKELQKKNESNYTGIGGGLNTRGMTEKKDNNITWTPKSRFKSRQPSKNSRK